MGPDGGGWGESTLRPNFKSEPFKPTRGEVPGLKRGLESLSSSIRLLASPSPRDNLTNGTGFLTRSIGQD